MGNWKVHTYLTSRHGLDKPTKGDNMSWFTTSKHTVNKTHRICRSCGLFHLNPKAAAHRHSAQIQGLSTKSAFFKDLFTLSLRHLMTFSHFQQPLFKNILHSLKSFPDSRSTCKQNLHEINNRINHRIKAEAPTAKLEAELNGLTSWNQLPKSRALGWFWM